MLALRVGIAWDVVVVRSYAAPHHSTPVVVHHTPSRSKGVSQRGSSEDILGWWITVHVLRCHYITPRALGDLRVDHY